jgi:hypothetical protein
MNVTTEALLEMIGGLYVENALLKETIRQLQAQLKQKEKPEEPAKQTP